MPHRYRAAVRSSRDGATTTDDPSFSSWTEFGQAQAIHHGHHTDGAPWLCDILAEATNRRSDLPLAWPTLVLGSECLRLLTPETQRAIELLPRVLAQNLRPDQTRTLQFVEQLIADRMGLAVAPRALATTPAGGRQPGDVAALFDEAPAADTDGLSDEQERGALRAAQHASTEFEEWELNLVEAAASVTESYFTVKAQNLHSVSRWSTDVLRLDAKEDAVQKRLAHDSLVRLANTLDQSKKEQLRASQIVGDLSAGLARGSGEISLASLEALTEIAWQIITRHFTIFSDYPEWPEFLVRLSLDNERSRLIRQGPPRPALRSALDATHLIEGALKQQTRESADGYLKGQPAREAARVDAYAKFADLLYRMARFRAKTLPRRRPAFDAGSSRQQSPVAPRSRVTKPPPPASAFVTTFDLELEFALAHGHPDQPFVIAVPVNVIDNAEGVKEHLLASTMWLGCVVRPEPKRDLYDRIVNPPADAWFTLGTLVTMGKGVDTPLAEGGSLTELEANALRLVRRALPEGVDVLGELPVIVRLAGAPLINLPKLQHANQTFTDIGDVVRQAAGLPLVSTDDGAPTWNGSSVQVEIQLAHATLLDEHNALRLSLPEVLGEHPWGLPRDLAAPVNSNGYWRYWMLLGVELSDPVIRYRVFSQILGAGLTTSRNSSPGENAKGYSRPNRAGVALNRKSMNARAIDLLLWCDFDIVRDNDAPAPLSAEIEHWLGHLAVLDRGRADALESWPGRGQECQLPAGAGGEGENA